jgi:hypothetical protein
LADVAADFERQEKSMQSHAPKIIEFEGPPRYLFDHGKDAKKMADNVAVIKDHLKNESEHAKADAEPKKIAERKGLSYAKWSMWIAFVALVLTAWVYIDAKIDAYDAKIDAMESSKANAAEQKKLRDEIQALAQANKEDRDAFKAALAAERLKAADVQNASAKKGAAGRQPSSK